MEKGKTVISIALLPSTPQKSSRGSLSSFSLEFSISFAFQGHTHLFFSSINFHSLSPLHTLVFFFLSVSSSASSSTTAPRLDVLEVSSFSMAIMFVGHVTALLCSQLIVCYAMLFCAINFFVLSLNFHVFFVFGFDSN